MDLIERLREQAEWHNDGHGPLHKEAADEIERLLAAVEKGEYLAQAAGRAMRDHGGAVKFLDLNAAVAEFRRASGTGPVTHEQPPHDISTATKGD